MKHINLLPQKKTFHFQVTVLVVALIVLAIIATSMVYFNWFKGVYNLALEERDKKLTEVKTLEAAQAVQEIKVAGAVDGKTFKPISLSSILKDIAKKTPSKVQVDKIGTNEETTSIVIEASLSNTEILAEFQDNLAHTDWCENAAVVSLGNESGGDAHQIKLECPGE